MMKVTKTRPKVVLLNQIKTMTFLLTMALVLLSSIVGWFSSSHEPTPVRERQPKGVSSQLEANAILNNKAIFFCWLTANNNSTVTVLYWSAKSHSRQQMLTWQMLTWSLCSIRDLYLSADWTSNLKTSQVLITCLYIFGILEHSLNKLKQVAFPYHRLWRKYVTSIFSHTRQALQCPGSIGNCSTFKTTKSPKTRCCQ